jgi:hypothetical protein
MPLYRLLHERAFDDQMVAAMGDAYERALVTLGLKDRTDPATLFVAETVLALAEGGLRSSEKIYSETIAAFQQRK